MEKGWKWFQKTIICRLATYVNSLPLSGKTIHMRNQPRASDAREGQAGGLVVLILG